MTYEQALADASRALRNAFPDRWENILSQLIAPAPVRPRAALGLMAENPPREVWTYTIRPTLLDDGRATVEVRGINPDTRIEIIVEKGDAEFFYASLSTDGAWKRWPIYSGEVIRIGIRGLSLWNHGTEPIECRVLFF